MTTSKPPRPADLLHKYQALKDYVELRDEHIELARQAWPLVEHSVPVLVGDFYEEILRHEETRRILSGPEQVQRLQRTLAKWVKDTFTADHDDQFVQQRWQIGYRHVQLGLEHIWVSAAMSRLREGLLRALRAAWTDTSAAYSETASAVRRLMDLDLALIEDAYHAESCTLHLARERDFAEGIIETAQAIVMLVDGRGVIVRSNAFLMQLIDQQWRARLAERPAFLSKTPFRDIYELIDGNTREFLSSVVSRVLSGDHVPAFETELMLPQGRHRIIRWQVRRLSESTSEERRSLESSLRYSDGKSEESVSISDASQLILFVGQDITDLKNAEYQLVRQERLAAIGQTMTGLAHESRNAFQRSQASLETLLLELEDRPSAVQLIERIQRAHDHLLHLYEEVLQFARPVRLELQSFRLATLVGQTWTHIQQTGAATGVTLNLQNNVANDEMVGDPFMLEQVLRNLLENAVQAGDSTASIDVRLSDAWVGGNNGIELTVRDYGKGIPTEYLERIFEPFFTTRSRGTGLGLPIARRLIESHGGRLTLANAENKGTLATILLPLVAVPEKEIVPVTEDTRRTKTSSDGYQI